MNTQYTSIPTIGEIVRKIEDDYIYGTVQSSKYVEYSQYNTIEKIYAYLNSTHISGKKDSQGRDKPFFNIVVAAANIWMRATDIDRKDIRIRAARMQSWIDAFLATVILQDWMKKSKFGMFLNKWGRILSRYGSCVVKVIEKDGELFIRALPWSKIIVDPIDFESNPKIEPMDLTLGELYKRVQTHGYDKDVLDAFCHALETRKTTNKHNKDTKPGFVRVYEYHHYDPLVYITGNPEDADTYVHQMHVITYVAKKEGKETKYEDFTLFKGKEDRSPYFITHLIEEDDRTLAIGAVEYLFQSQFMQNHSMKTIKDLLDMASKTIFKTTDEKFIGNNFLTDLEQGAVLHYTGDLDRLNNSPLDVVSHSNFASAWKSLGNEIVGVSDAMLGVAPKAGTAWRLQETILNENYSLFELMTENKGLYLEEIFREVIAPHIKKKLDNKDEVTAILNAYDIDRVDALYIKNYSIKEVKAIIKRKIIDGDIVTPEEQDIMLADTQEELRSALKALGEQRYFKPSDFDDKTWKEQFKDLEWELEFDVTGEQKNVQEMLTTLNTALQMILTPGFNENRQAQMVVGEILNLTGAMSPVRFNSISNSAPPKDELEPGGGGEPDVPPPTQALLPKK